VVNTQTGEILAGCQDDHECDLRTWRLRREVCLLVTNQLRPYRRDRRYNINDPEDTAPKELRDRLLSKHIRTALRFRGLAHKTIAAWPKTWHDRLDSFVTMGCMPWEYAYRRKLLQDALVECIKDGQPFEPTWEVEDNARRSHSLYDHLRELLGTQRNADQLAYITMCLLDCAARARGKQFSRSVRQLALDSGGVVDAKHVGRYLERIADGYGKPAVVPIFAVKKGKTTGRRLATYYTLNPQYAYLLDMI